MTDALLVRHLLAAHPGASAPWFANSGYIGVISVEALERLHAELVAQGEDCSVVADIPRTDWGSRLRRVEMGVA